ncbi:LytR/AlgR family response regulator transcription factor [Sinomicrobium sp. M5D2P9]
MHVVIVEDEDLAAQDLKKRLLNQDILEVHSITRMSTVKEAVAYFRGHTPDLVFLDIHLGDGNSMAILDVVRISVPVIFTTAYDAYALQAFKHFTVDYLLKPFDTEDLYRALNKYNSIKEKYSEAQKVEALKNHLRKDKEDFLRRFLVSHGYRLVPVEDKDIIFFYATGKHLFIYVNNGNSYLYNSTVKELIHKLDPEIFFRINRNYIIHVQAIAKVIKHRSQRLELVLKRDVPKGEPVFVSKNEVRHFMEWMGK